jgi:peptidoglycan/xylan/chitin deacetylase (PgdA/CDA1 family)
MRPLLVWTYHRILPLPGRGSVPVETFEKQVRHLIKNNYTFLDTKGLKGWFAGKLPAGKYTLLTFDDGWADNLYFADPVIKKYKVKAVMAVNTSLINPSDMPSENDTFSLDYKDSLKKAVYGESYSAFLNLEGIKKLHETGRWDIQAHGCTHLGCYHSLEKIRGFYPAQKHWTMRHALGEKPFKGAPRAEFKSILAHPRTFLSEKFKEKLKKKSTEKEWAAVCAMASDPFDKRESDREFTDRIKKDFENCREYLKTNLGVMPESFFWPWGHYSEKAEKAALSAGYEMLFTMDKAPVIYGKTPARRIPRIAVPGSLARFIKQEKVFSNTFLRSMRNFFSG